MTFAIIAGLGSFASEFLSPARFFGIAIGSGFSSIPRRIDGGRVTGDVGGHHRTRFRPISDSGKKSRRFFTAIATSLSTTGCGPLGESPRGLPRDRPHAGRTQRDERVGGDRAYYRGPVGPDAIGLRPRRSRCWMPPMSGDKLAEQEPQR